MSIIQNLAKIPQIFSGEAIEFGAAEVPEIEDVREIVSSTDLDRIRDALEGMGVDQSELTNTQLHAIAAIFLERA